MFTMRRKVVEGVNGGDTVSKGRRRASTFIEQQNCNRDMPNGEIDGQKRLKSKRNSLMIPGSSTPNNECLIHLMLGPGCFRELRRNCGGGSIYSIAIYNLICSLLVFALRILSHPHQAFDKNGKKDIGRKCPEHQHPVTVLLEAPKVPLKALRIVLRACQSALAYRIRQCILLEPDTFLGIHQRRMATIDLLLLDTYDFKIQICLRQKLSKYLGLSALFDLQQIWQPSTSVQKPLFGDKSEGFQPNNGSGWTDLKRDFLTFFAENPSYFAANPANNVLWNKDISTPASLGRFMRKDGNVLIELVEFDLDSVPRDTIKKAIPTIQNTIQSPTKDKKDENNTKIANNSMEKMPTKNSSVNKFEVDAFSKSLPSYKKAMNLMKVHDGIGDHNRHKSLEERGEGRENQKIGEKLAIELTEATEISRLAKSVQSVVGWLGEHGERRLAKLEEVEEAFGTSNSSLCENVEMGKIDREKRELAEEMENILNNLATVADQLKAMGQKNTRKITYFGISGDENVEKRPESEQQKKSKELIAIGQLLLGAQSRANALRAGLTSFTLRMERGRQFQKTVDEFHNAANSFILDLCSERTIEIYGRELNDQKIRGKIAELRGNMEKLEKLASSAMEAGSILCSILMENNKQSLSDLCSAELATIDGRRRRCSALMELRVGRLNQQMEIIKCEQFGEQIIKRFNNSLAENNVKILGDLLKNRRNGKRLVDYARQLANLASILRKINQFEATPAERFNRELEILWRMLEKKYENGESGL